MTCLRTRELLDLTVGATLDPSADRFAATAEAELRTHLDGCPACASERDAMRRTAAAVTRALSPDPTAERQADAALVARVLERLPAHRRSRLLSLRPAMRLAVAAALLAAATLVVARIALRPAVTPRPDVARAPDPEPEPIGPGLVPGYAGPRFTNVAAAAGVDVENHTGSADTKDWMVETVGHGAAVLDMDGDGDLDLFVPDGNRFDPDERVHGTWRLFRNEGDLRFTDVTRGSGLESDAWAGGAVAGDVNADGRPDLFVPCFGRNHLFLNLGGGRFEDATDRSGASGLEEEWSTAASLCDLDGDGDLDLYVSNYADMRKFMVEARSGRGCTWRSMPVACGPQPLPPQQDRLFVNRGDGTFDDATIERMPRLKRYSFQAVALDVNGDRAPDIFVSADGHPNLLLVNDGRGHFLEQALAAGVATDGAGHEQACMGVAAGDVDGDGLSDLFVTNFSHEPNVLYRSRGGSGIPSYADVTKAAGLLDAGYYTLGWGASLADLDCDGDLDLVYANGHLYPDVGRAIGTTTYEQNMSVFVNDGSGRFAEVSASAGRDVVHRRAHRGLVVADLDDDGDLDAFLTVLNGRAVLLRNDGRGCGTSLRLRLLRRNGVEAAGARVEARVRAADGTERLVVRELLLGSSFGSSEDPRVHVGLGGAERVESLAVVWPFGEREEFGALAAGAWMVQEGDGAAKRVR